MVIYGFVPPFREAKFCGVPSCVFDILGCAAGEKVCETPVTVSVRTLLLLR
jgi:hypothetical protein